MMWPVWTAAALAADPTFAGADPSLTADSPPQSQGTAEFGGVWTTGNTDTVNLNGALHFGHGWGRNRARIDVGANLGQSAIDTNADGHIDATERAARLETARKYSAEARTDRYVGDRDSLYALSGALIDPFAGYDTRTHVQAGWSHRLVSTADTKLIGELGADLAHEDFVEGVEPTEARIIAARGLVGLEHRFNPNVTFSDSVEAYENVLDRDDLRVLSTAAITSALGAGLSVRVSWALTFDNAPVSGFQKVDQTTMVTFVANVLPSG